MLVQAVLRSSPHQSCCRLLTGLHTQTVPVCWSCKLRLLLRPVGMYVQLAGSTCWESMQEHHVGAGCAEKPPY